MARTPFAVVDGIPSQGVSISRTAIAADGITGAGYALTGATQEDRLLLIASNSGSATGVFTIYAGAYSSASIGDLETIIAPGADAMIGPVEGARFKQADDSFYLGSGITGTVMAIQL